MTFSIVIPTYNGSRFIEKAILSVLRQHRAADEIIISDDNSSDATLFICEKYKEKIKIFLNREGPSGFVNGWNNAINKASGDFVSILHQDDVLHPDFLLKAEEVLTEHPQINHLFVSCNYIDGNGDNIAVFPKHQEPVVLLEGIDYVRAYQADYGNMPHIHRCPGVLTHRSVFEICSYNPEAGHIADDDFFYRVAKHATVAGILYPLAYYRIHQSSETGALGDYKLVKRLSRDYIFQVKQWKGDSFLDDNAFNFFVCKAKKYIRRRLGYALKNIDVKDMFVSVGLYRTLQKELR